MSELARQRSARDIWVSRGHLYALGAGAALTVLTAFGVGFSLGRNSVELPPPAATHFTGEAGDDGLVELLARVDAAATPGGGVQELTFPDALRGEGEASGVPAELDLDNDAVLSPGSAALPEQGDAAPSGRWTIIAASLEDRGDADAIAEGLRARELDAWVGVEQLEGETRFRVAVGGWGSKTEAEDAMEDLEGPIAAGGGSAIVARY